MANQGLPKLDPTRPTSWWSHTRRSHNKQNYKIAEEDLEFPLQIFILQNEKWIIKIFFETFIHLLGDNSNYGI